MKRRPETQPPAAPAGHSYGGRALMAVFAGFSLLVVLAAMPAVIAAAPLLDGTGKLLAALEAVMVLMVSGLGIGVAHGLGKRWQRAQEALADSERKYRTVVDNIGIGVSLISPRMEILALNRQMKTWFPHAEAERRPLCYRTFNTPPRETVCSYCPAAKTLRDGETHEAITDTPTPAGTRNYRVISSALRDEDGQVTAAIETSEDVTERRQAEKELEVFRRFANASGQGFAMGTLDGRCTYANRTLCRLTGRRDPQELIGRAVVELYPGSAGQRFTAEILPAVRRDGQWTGEVAFQLPNGRQRTTIENHFLIRDEHGEPERLATVVTDITGQKRVERALERASRFHQQLLETAATAMFTVDAERRITSVNDAFCTLTGFAEAEVVGQPCHILWGDARDHSCSVFATAQTGPVVRREGAVRTKDGRRLTVLKNATILRDDTAHITGAIESFVDVTELTAAREAAEAASRAKSEFLANMSHEIRTPLNAIIGMSELALDTQLSVEQRDYLETVSAAADALLELINDLLDVAKIEAGKLELDQIDFNVRHTVEDAARTLAVRAHAKGLELACDIATDVHEELTGDPGRLRQVIVNLVGNAIKFTDEGEVVVGVRVEADGNGETTLHFTIRDTGIGVPADKQEIIWRMFAQADSGSSRKYGGTGLGLAISSQIVAMMGGRIWLESPNAPADHDGAAVGGPGSTFHFTACFRKSTTPRPAAGSQAPDQLREMPVLVVDDNAANRQILVELLAKWQALPAAVGSGALALTTMEKAVHQQRPFRLVLLDVNMPDMDGFAVAAYIKQHPELAGATIMMLTSVGSRGDAARCRKLGVAAYLTKPIKRDDLLDAILTTLALPKVDRPREALVTRHSVCEARARLRILLAEDNVTNQKLVIGLLVRRGHTLEVAANGSEAVAAHGRQPFDLILMDVQMPGMDGFEATAAIRAQEQQRGGHIPIVAMTAYAMAGDRDRCLRAGMDGYISKPIRSEELYTLVEDLGLRQPPVEKPAADPAPAAPGAELATAAVVNRDELLGRVGQRLDLLREVVNIFLEDGPARLAEIREALTAGNSAVLQRAAHTLKGTVGNLAAGRAYQAAAALEALIKSGNLTDAEAAFQVLEQEIERVKETLMTMIGETHV